MSQQSKKSRFSIEKVEARCTPGVGLLGGILTGLAPTLTPGLGATVISLAPAVAQLPGTVVALGATVNSLAPVVAQLPGTVVTLGATVASL